MADSLLHISPEAQETIKKLDDTGYFGLSGKGENGLQRIDQYLVAVAMGVDSVGIPLSKQVAFIREGSVGHRARALMTALLLKDKLDAGESVAEISDLNSVFANTQAYANSGFMVLGDMADSKADEKLMKEWIADLNERYKELFPGE